MEVIEINPDYHRICPFRTITTTTTFPQENKMVQEISYPECYYNHCDFYSVENHFCELAISKLGYQIGEFKNES